MRVAASGLVVVSVTVGALGFGCGDKKPREGLPPAAEWQAPSGSAGDAGPVPAETVVERLARCAAEVFVEDAARDGNLPDAVLDELATVPDTEAIVIARALAKASARLPTPDQHAMLLASSARRLIERKDTTLARTYLQRAAGLLDSAVAPDNLRPEVAGATIARAWGLLGDERVRALGKDAGFGPHAARGLAEAGHDELADEVLRTSSMLPSVDPVASSELAVTDLIRGRTADARRRMATAPADWRTVHALVLASAAVERNHPDARALLDDAIALADQDVPGPSVLEQLAAQAHALGDADVAARLRARLRTVAAREPDLRKQRSVLYKLHVLAIRAGAHDEAREIFAQLEAAGGPPWILGLARAEGLVETRQLKAAIEEVERLPVDAAPPRGVLFVEVVMRHFAGPRDPELERWLTAHICDGIE